MGARTVLVVDSSPLTLRRAEEALRDTGFRAVFAGSQQEAEQIIATDDVAVVVASLVFPRGNGYDLAKQVKTQHPEAVVFLLCGPFEVYSAERARSSGVLDRVSRPFTVENFRKQLEGVLGPLNEPEEEKKVEKPAEKPVEKPVEAPRPPEPGAYLGAIAEPPHVPGVEERLATFVPRSYQKTSTPPVDPGLIPVVERVVQEVLPEVVEAVMVQSLYRSKSFRELLKLAVAEAVEQQLLGVVERLVRERLAEIEAQADAVPDEPAA